MKAAELSVIFAAERTMLAWIRTGLAMMGLGFVVARFSLILKDSGAFKEKAFDTPGMSVWFGVLLVLLGVGVNIFAGYAYAKNIKRLMQQGNIDVKLWSMGRIVSLLLAFIGLFMAAYLLMLKR